MVYIFLILALCLAVFSRFEEDAAPLLHDSGEALFQLRCNFSPFGYNDAAADDDDDMLH